MQEYGALFSNLCSSRQADLHHTASGLILRVGDDQLSIVPGDDLLAHRQADAAAPGGGASLIELILDVGQFLRRNARAVVSDFTV